MAEPEYKTLLASIRRSHGEQGIDACLRDNSIDMILAPGDAPMFCLSSPAGYPNAAAPLGVCDFNGRPFGVQMLATAHGEGVLVRAMSAWEAVMPARRPPVMLYENSGALA